MNCHGERRFNGPTSRGRTPTRNCYKKCDGQKSVLAYLGHVLLDNRHGLVVNVCATAATGTAERETAVLMLSAGGRRRRTVGADKNFDVASFVAAARKLGVTPHVTQKGQYTAIDGRTTGRAAYAVSQRRRKLVEQVFGWMKTVGLLSKLRHRRGEPVDWITTFTAVAYNMARLRTLRAEV